MEAAGSGTERLAGLVRPVATLTLLVVVMLAAAAGDTDRLDLAGGRVSIDVPLELELADAQEQLPAPGSPPPCDDGFAYCLYIPDQTYAGTNLRSAGLSIDLREDLRSYTACLLAQPDGWSDLQPGVVLPEPPVSLATSRFGDVGEGAAGSFTVGEVLRLFDGVECWEFESRVALSRFENFPAGKVREFTVADRADLAALFWSVIDSALVDGRPVSWPSSGTGDLGDFVRVELPAEATSPLTLRGEARGTWFSEGSFPVRLMTRDGAELATGVVAAQGEWMTEEFVPFQGRIEYVVDGPTPAVLVLERDNPSGLPEHAAAARFELLLR